MGVFSCLGRVYLLAHFASCDGIFGLVRDMIHMIHRHDCYFDVGWPDDNTDERNVDASLRQFPNATRCVNEPTHQTLNGNWTSNAELNVAKYTSHD